MTSRELFQVPSPNSLQIRPPIWCTNPQTVPDWRKALGVGLTNPSTNRVRSTFSHEPWAIRARMKGRPRCAPFGRPEDQGSRRMVEPGLRRRTTWSGRCWRRGGRDGPLSWFTRAGGGWVCWMGGRGEQNLFKWPLRPKRWPCLVESFTFYVTHFFFS
jgi:hypothetical protein